MGKKLINLICGDVNSIHSWNMTHHKGQVLANLVKMKILSAVSVRECVGSQFGIMKPKTKFAVGSQISS